MDKLTLIKSMARLHHQQASLFAGGYTAEHIAEVLHVPLTMVCMLEIDPTFKRLITSYRDKPTKINED
jgi:hypothetical protein